MKILDECIATEIMETAKVSYYNTPSDSFTTLTGKDKTMGLTIEFCIPTVHISELQKIDFSEITPEQLNAIHENLISNLDLPFDYSVQISCDDQLIVLDTAYQALQEQYKRRFLQENGNLRMTLELLSHRKFYVLGEEIPSDVLEDAKAELIANT